MTRRTAVQRLLVVVVGGGAVVLVTGFLGLEPRGADVVLLVALAVCALGLVVDTVDPHPLVWFPPPVHASVARGRDGLTLGAARLIESHTSQNRPDADLRDRLAALADGELRARHGVVLASPEGERLLGPEIASLLTGPVRRMSLRTIAQCLRTIEEL